MADINKRIILHDLSGAQLYPVTSASLVQGLDAKIKGLVADGFSIEKGSVELGTNTAITSITLTTNANGTAKLSFQTGTIHTGGASVDGFVKITTDANGHVTAGTDVTIDDILGLSVAGDKTKVIATESYVDAQLSDGIAAAQALHFCGTASKAGDVTDTTLGAVYIASGAFEFNGENLESGDMIVCVVAHKPAQTPNPEVPAQYKVIQANIDGAVVAANNLANDKLVLGSGSKDVKTSDISVSDVVTAQNNVANGNLVIGNGAKGVTDSSVGVGDLKTALNITDTKTAAGKVWTTTDSGAGWADPNHISVKAGTGIDVTGEGLEKTIALATAPTVSATTGTAVTLSTGTGSVDAVTGVTVDTYGRVTGVEKTSFSVTLPAVPVQDASDGVKLDGTTVKHGDVTLSTSTNATTLDFGGSFAVDTVTRDKFGHVTGVTTTTITLPSAQDIPDVDITDDGVVIGSADGHAITIAHSTNLTGLTGSETSKTVGQTSDATPDYAGTFKVPAVTVDKYGHVTAASEATITLPTAQNTFDKISGKVVGEGESLVTSTQTGTLNAAVGSTINLGTGLALMPGTNSSASIVAALSYTLVDAGVSGNDEPTFA